MSKSFGFNTILKLIPFLIFFLLSLRFVVVYLSVLAYPLLLVGLAGSILLYGLVWLRSALILCIYIACVPLVTGIQNMGYLKMAPILDFGFAVIFLAWLPKVLFKKNFKSIMDLYLNMLVTL